MQHQWRPKRRALPRHFLLLVNIMAVGPAPMHLVLPLHSVSVLSRNCRRVVSVAQGTGPPVMPVVPAPASLARERISIIALSNRFWGVVLGVPALGVTPKLW